MELEVNTLFNERYRLLAEKGRGAFGEVWLARDEQLDLDVAIKIYIALDDRGIEEFKSEYRTAYALNHPNLLHAYHFDVYERRPYCVMPYCPESAVSLIGNMDEKTAWMFISDVAEGLAYLHGKDIVHRDIKPDNILRDAEGVFQITDFGISMRMRSTLRRNSTRLQSETEIGGTIGYMAPELFSKNPEAVKATDIWALGATLYELLTGELPFMGQGGVMQLHGAEIPELNSDYSRELNAVVTSCMASDTWDRPTADKLVECATKHLSGESIYLSRERKANAQTKRKKNNRQANNKKRTAKVCAIVLGCVAVAAVLVFIGIKFWGHETDNVKPEQYDYVTDPFLGDMVFVKGGTFKMGSDGGWHSSPAHYVTLSDFYISKYEITFKQWRAIMDKNPEWLDNPPLKSYEIGQGDEFPVGYVQWNEVQQFIKRLNAKTGKEYRLPTEAEWEYAARGGSKSKGYWFSGSDRSDDVCAGVFWITDRRHGEKDKWHSTKGYLEMSRKYDSYSMTWPVGSKNPNELGIYDMSGNVAEWCADLYGEYSSDTQNNPKGPSSGSRYVFRGGGSFHDLGIHPLDRFSAGPYYAEADMGFRLVLSEIQDDKLTPIQE